MSALFDLLRRIGAALIGTPSARLVPAKVKLATRNGYGSNKAGPPRS